MAWFLYLLECSDGSVYTGIATDVAARFDKHVSGTGARYTRSRKPVRILASFELADRSSASSAEYWVKRLAPADKRALAAGGLTLQSVLPVVAIDTVDEDGEDAG
ncbi:excinuclease ABC subunit C [Paraburkholderia monticola]|uniref:Excinuclease ABC subunit C n=1 Tax=Paraburkholderia monticola TaxID=1399968 RepID=A0A149PVY9_9BURK|nr:GIY-YIG nuclease family protein [Paraburkholderia monticola]KXU89230.1 excinuclease ABC subunit C [Paraburkholderia monticola]